MYSSSICLYFLIDYLNFLELINLVLDCCKFYPIELLLLPPLIPHLEVLYSLLIT